MGLTAICAFFSRGSTSFAGENHHHPTLTDKVAIKVKDPVGGKIVSVDHESETSVYNGVTFYFENEKNKKEFEENKSHYYESASIDYHFYTNQAFASYFHIQEALAQDSMIRIQNSAKIINEALGVAAHLTHGINKDDLKAYQNTLIKAKEAASKIAELENAKIENIRATFGELSEAMVTFSKSFNKEKKGAISTFVFHCPMAFEGKGASWLQQTEQTANPYYGSSMLRCGKMTDTLMAICQVTGDEIADPKINVMYEGMTYYFCCKGCINNFKAAPEKFIYGLSKEGHAEHDHHE